MIAHRLTTLKNVKEFLELQKERLKVFLNLKDLIYKKLGLHMFDLKIGIIGCGYWGKNLIRNFYELNVLKYVCDIQKKADEIANKYGVESKVLLKFLKFLIWMA